MVCRSEQAACTGTRPASYPGSLPEGGEGGGTRQDDWPEYKRVPLTGCVQRRGVGETEILHVAVMSRRDLRWREAPAALRMFHQYAPGPRLPQLTVAAGRAAMQV